MTAPYEAPPAEVPERVPENVGMKASQKTLILWLLLIVVFVAFYQVFQPSESSHPTPHPTPVVPSAPLPMWPWAIPGITFLLLAGVFVWLRSRLPARYRTGELRIQQREVSKAGEGRTPEPFEPIVLKGTDSVHSRTVHLRIDDGGLHWSSEAALLQPAQWLDVRWDELRSLGLNARPSKWRVLALWSTIIGTFIGFYQVLDPHSGSDSAFGLAPALGLVVLGGLVGFIAWKRKIGVLTLVTATHQLTFLSRELAASLRERIQAVAKARRLDLFPETAQRSSGWAALYFLFAGPFTELRTLLRSEASLRTETLAQATQPVDEDAVTAGTIQRKLFGLWRIGWGGILPAAFGAAYALHHGEWLFFPLGYFVAWLVGFIAYVRLTNTIARLSGLTVIR